MAERFHPPMDAGREPVDLPIVEVTVLEDRAVVCRRGTVEVRGTRRVGVLDVATVLQDVSLRAEASSGRVADARVHRAIRIRREDKPERIAELDARLEALQLDFDDARERGRRAEARYHGVVDMLDKGAREIPEDAAWGLVEPAMWADTLSTLFTRGREHQEAAIDAFHRQEDRAREHAQVATERRVLDRADQHFTAWIALDLAGDGPLEVEVRYTVPNALWRPLHRARLADDALELTARAAIWQRTGEDWTDAALVLSTARGSLGTDPPRLTDDLLEARKRSDQVVVEAREVAIERLAGDPAPRDGVELPGVDDGGEIQNLRPPGLHTVPSDGRPVFVDTFAFTAPAELTRVAMPELSPRVFLKCTAVHGGAHPVLAGPVELVRDHGVVGWTEVLYVAPGAPFELGFGTEDQLRVARTVRRTRDEVDDVDKWRRRRTRVDLFASNLSDTPARVEVRERIPVSEIEHVKTRLLDKTTREPTLDGNGHVRWTLDLAGHAHEKLRLDWELAVAPGVDADAL